MEMKTASVRRRRRRRRYSLWQIQIAAVCAAVIFVCILAFGGKDYDDFLDALAMRESSGNYEAVNRFGYLGRYQLGGLALQDAGFQDESGNWTELAASFGVSSDDDFLASPKAQEEAVRAYHGKLCGYIRACGLESYIGTEYCGVKVTKSGLLAACHLVGVKALCNALERGEPVFDGNGVPASEYMDLFSGYNIARVWKS